MLDQIAIGGGVGVERIDRGQQVGLQRVRGRGVPLKRDPDRFAALLLFTHVAGAGWIVADEDHAEADRAAARGQATDSTRDVLQHGHGLACE